MSDTDLAMMIAVARAVLEGKLLRVPIESLERALAVTVLELKERLVERGAR